MRLPWLLFAGTAVVVFGASMYGIQPNDEGLMLQAAARIADGQVPYRDFWWFYPPGQPLLLGALWATLGPSLLAWKVVRALAAGAVAVLAWRLARRGGAPDWAAGLVWLATTARWRIRAARTPTRSRSRSASQRCSAWSGRRWPAR